MRNIHKFYFILKEDYILDESMPLNAHKILFIYEKLIISS